MKYYPFHMAVLFASISLVMSIFELPDMIPIVKWNMYSIVPSHEPVYYVEVTDSQGRILCESPKCPEIYGGKQVRFYIWAQSWGRAREGGDAEEANQWRDRFISGLKSPDIAALQLKVQDLDWINVETVRWRDGDSVERVELR